MMFHLRRCTPLPQFLCSVSVSLLLCCFGSHYSFCVLLSCKCESLQFVAFGRCGFPVTWMCSIAQRQLFLSGHTILSQSLTNQSASALISHQFPPNSLIFFLCQAKKLCAECGVRGRSKDSKSKEASDGTTTWCTHLRAAGCFVEKVLVPVMKVIFVYLHKIYVSWSVYINGHLDTDSLHWQENNDVKTSRTKFTQLAINWTEKACKCCILSVDLVKSA